MKKRKARNKLVQLHFARERAGIGKKLILKTLE
jgi:hypothetical protein